MEITLVIEQIKPDYYWNGKLYRRVVSSDGKTVLLDSGFSFLPGMEISADAPDTVTNPAPEEFGTPEAKALWLNYYSEHILSNIRLLNASEEKQQEYELFQELVSFMKPESTFFFLRTFSPMILTDKLQNNRYWFYGYIHGLKDENFVAINRSQVVSTFALRLEQLKTAVCYCLKKNEGIGHTWMSMDALTRRLELRMQSDKHLPASKELLCAILHQDERFYFDGKRVAFVKAYETEKEILQNIRILHGTQSLFGEQLQLSDHLCEEQKQAVRGIVSGSNISILTGKPGTGKTTTIAAIIRQYIGVKNIALLAPTGQAVHRMRESLLEEFDEEQLNDFSMKTICKFVGYEQPHFLQCEAIRQAKDITLCIVDESSMADIYRFADLLRALDLTKCKLVLVGDKNQLPSIYAGNVLTDLIGIGVPTFYLEQNHRSVKSIFDNGNVILSGDVSLPLTTDEYFRFLPETCLDELLSTLDLSSPHMIFLSPYRKAYNAKGCHINGNVTEINQMVHHRMFSSNGYQVGDKVVCTKNNYKQEYFNGEFGFITSICEDGIGVCMNEERTVWVKDKTQLDYSYATTIHKAQGSEYRDVYLYLPKDMPDHMLTREILYTAVTRAKEHVTIIGEKQMIYRAMQISANERQTFLSDGILSISERELL